MSVVIRLFSCFAGNELLWSILPDAKIPFVPMSHGRSIHRGKVNADTIRDLMNVDEECHNKIFIGSNAYCAVKVKDGDVLNGRYVFIWSPDSNTYISTARGRLNPDSGTIMVLKDALWKGRDTVVMLDIFSNK